jgi:hypothetical protein
LSAVWPRFLPFRRDQLAGGDACLRNSDTGGAKPCPSHHGVLMIAEDGLDRGGGGRKPAGLAADDRCDRLGGIAEPLGPDADGVPSDVGRVLPEGLSGAFQPSPGPAD